MSAARRLPDVAPVLPLVFAADACEVPDADAHVEPEAPAERQPVAVLHARAAAPAVGEVAAVGGSDVVTEELTVCAEVMPRQRSFLRPPSEPATQVQLAAVGIEPSPGGMTLLPAVHPVRPDRPMRSEREFYAEVRDQAGVVEQVGCDSWSERAVNFLG